MAVWLTSPCRHWVVLGSFIPRLYSGTLISRLFGLNVLLTLTLGSRNHFLPESPDIIDDRLLRQKILWILYDILSRLCACCLCKFPTTEISLWITTHTCQSYILSHWSCYYKMPWTALLFPKILWAYCLAVPCHLNTPTDNFVNLLSIRSSLVDSCTSQKSS